MDRDINNSNKKVLFYAETPFQVFAELCLLFAYDQDAFSKESSIDMIICNRSVFLETIVSYLKSLNIFQNVWLVPRFKHDVRRFGSNFFIDYFFRRQSTYDSFIEMYPMLQGVEYDVIVFSGTAKPLAYIKMFCGRFAESIMIEDGLGTYAGEMFHELQFLDNILVLDGKDTPRLRLKYFIKKILRFITWGNLTFNPSTLYLFDISDQVKRRYKNIKFEKNRIPKGDEFKKLSSVFPINSGDTYLESRYIFLSTTDLDNKTNALEESYFNTINSCLTDSILLRSHPREIKNFFSKKPYYSDVSGDLWEMLIAKGYINNNSVLISICSTAQLNPKLVFGIEPYLIFLYDLFPDNSCIEKSTARKTSEELRNMYDDKEKIYCPSSIEELSALLQSFQG